MYDAENPNQELLDRLLATCEIEGTTIEATGRIRGQWHEVLEVVPGMSEAFAYWAALDDHQPIGYKIVEHGDRDADAMDLDLKYMIDGDDRPNL